MGTRIIAIIALLLCLLLVCFYRPAMLAARDGFDLWLEVVMPALFPFMVCTSILQRSGTFNLNSNKRSKAGFQALLFRSFLHAAYPARLPAQG